MGRPPKINPELIEEVAQAIRAGNYLEPSCHLAGIGKVTAYNWIKRGRAELERVAKSKRAKIRKKEQLYVQFLNAVKEADAVAEARDVATIGIAAQKQWQAAAWRLERKHFDRWGRKATTVVEGGENPVKLEASTTIVQYPVNPRDTDDEGGES